MIGTRLDEVDAPRIIKSDRGWWFVGNGTWTLLKPEHIASDGTVREDIDEFLHNAGAYRPRTPKSFSLTVLTSTACNLGCGYCFQNTALDPAGGHRPLRIARERLSTEIIDKIVAFTRNQMAEVGLDKLYLLLFGGEPLLNPRGCLEMLDRAGGIGLQLATMTTNGVLLTPKLAAKLNQAGLRGIQITFDGSRQDHDQIRVKRSGGATFDTIVRNIGLATEVTDLWWNFRVNISHHNFDRVGLLFDQLRDHVDPSRCNVTLAWVGDAGFGYGNELRRLDDVAAAFADWSIAALDRGFKVVRPSMRTTCQICSVPGGRHGAVVNADGTLYSSWQSAGKSGFEVGDLDNGYLDVDTVIERWVTCGYEYEQAEPELVDRFANLVDGRILDYFYETNTL
jgi:uncharacterized protein